MKTRTERLLPQGVNPHKLEPGIYRVRCEGVEFNLSLVLCGWGLVRGVAGFKDGEKTPRKGRHLMISESIMDWCRRMELVAPDAGKAGAA